MQYRSFNHVLSAGNFSLCLASVATCALVLSACASTPGGNSTPAASPDTGGGSVALTPATGAASAFPGNYVDTGSVSASSPRRGSTAGEMFAGWPSRQTETGMMLVSKYGAPSVAGDQMMIWYDKAPYKMISLSRTEVMHNFPMPHPDYLTFTVMHRVPSDKLDELAQYDGSVWYHRTRGELSAQCDKAEANNLALNLAHDVMTGKRTVGDARAFYAKTMMAMMAGDKSSPYLTGLIFSVEPNAADPDVAAKM